MVVVDDDDVTRRGIAELLADRPELDVLVSLTHDQALGHPRWDGVDIALIDAGDPRKIEDQFPGVDVVESIRTRGGESTTVVIITGHFFDDACRRRMREAGADFYYNRIDLLDAAALYEAVLGCKDQIPPGVPPEQDSEQMFRLGISGATRVNEGLRFAREHPMAGISGSEYGKGPRARLRYRRLFGRHAQLQAVNADGRPPEREQETPSLPQIQRFVDWATKIKRTY